jgi:hypothetical protein
MCNCGGSRGAGGATPTRSFATNTVAPQTQQDSDCPYTLDDINNWLEKVNCFYDKGMYVNFPNISAKQIINYRGVLMSAQNYPTNICYFRSQLPEIKAFVTVIISTGQC